MAADLAGQPIAGLPVQAGGDSHVMNFGAFVTPENNILFDVKISTKRCLASISPST
jgi:hypothetical protein